MNLKLILVGAGLTLIAISNMIGHFAPPFSILATPFLLTFIITEINYKLFQLNFHLTVLYSFGLLLLNDILIRLYAGGTHDSVGKAWILLFSGIALLIAFITMLIYSFTTLRNNKSNFSARTVFTNIATVILLTIFVSSFYYLYLADF